MAEISVRYGRLIVLAKADTKYSAMLCLCDCGTQKVIRTNALHRGATQSCGCLRKERAAVATAKAHFKHGDASGGKSTVEYGAWISMKDRCLNPNEPYFYAYGGRGITICAEWLASFKTFLSDMGRKPTPKHSLDRINNDGNYEPGNCRWATATEQQRNKRNIRKIAFNGECMTVPEWAIRIGVRYQTLAMRLRMGWTIESALTTRTMTLSESGKRSCALRWGGLEGLADLG